MEDCLQVLTATNKELSSFAACPVPRLLMLLSVLVKITIL